MPPTAARVWRQLTASYLVTNGLVFLFSRRGPTAYGLHELIGALFLVAGLISVRRDDDDTTRYGVRLGGLFPGGEGDHRSLVRTVVESVPAALREPRGRDRHLRRGAAHLRITSGRALSRAGVATLRAQPAGRSSSSPRICSRVALTEELYFRGYLQTHLGDAFGVPR